MADELAAAKAAHEAAELSAAELANNAANVMSLLSAQLTSERDARAAAEEALASGRGRRSETARTLAPFLKPGVLRGLAAGLACGFAARFGGAAISALAGRVTDRTGARPETARRSSKPRGRWAAPPRQEDEEEDDDADDEPPPPRYRRSHY